MKIAVYGVGSPFGTDNIAKNVIAKLKIKLQDTPPKYEINIDYFDRPSIYLLELMKGCQTVHLIDAVVSNNKPGMLYRIDAISSLNPEETFFSTHALGVAEVLSLGKVLACLPEKIIIHGIEINPNLPQNADDFNVASECLAKKIAKEFSAGKAWFAL